MGKTVVDLPCVHWRLAFGLAALYAAKKRLPRREVSLKEIRRFTSYTLRRGD